MENLWLAMLLIYGGTAVASYFLGCFNGAVIVSKYILRDDIRNHGGGLTLVVILCDVLKAVLAVLLTSAVFGGAVAAKYWGGLFCLLGHMFPCMFKFKGGKGILSGGTIALILAVLTKYVSLGSLWAGASFPFISWYCYPDVRIVVLAFLCGGLVVWQHRANIKRLLAGNENKFSLHHKKEGGA